MSSEYKCKKNINKIQTKKSRFKQKEKCVIFAEPQ